MLNTTMIDTISHAYRTAEKQRRRIRPPSAEYQGFSIEDAYAAQRRWVEIKIAPFDIALEPGQFILGGSCTSVVEARADDMFHIDYGAFGSISVRFV